MLSEPAILVLASVLGALGPDPATAAGPAPIPRPRAVELAASKLWAPKKSRPQPASREADEATEEELLKPKTAPRAAQPARSRPRSRVKTEAEEAEAEEDGEDEADEEEEEERPRITKRAKKRYSDDEDDEDEEAEALLSMPPVLPRLVSFSLGAATLRRSFAYDAVSQGDTEFPRLGYQIGLEAFPLLNLPNAARMLGLGFSYGKEMGSAGLQQSNGSTISYPVSHGRWRLDVRYAIPVGERVVLAPAVGYGRINVDLERQMPVAPSGCLATSADGMGPCFGDVKASHLVLDLHIRIALSQVMGLSLSGGYLHGLGVSRDLGTIAAEADTSLRGFHANVALSLVMTPWLALQASLPFQRHGYTFAAPAGGNALAYRSANDSYYGLIVGAVIMTAP